MKTYTPLRRLLPLVAFLALLLSAAPSTPLLAHQDPLDATAAVPPPVAPNSTTTDPVGPSRARSGDDAPAETGATYVVRATTTVTASNEAASSDTSDQPASDPVGRFESLTDAPSYAQRSAAQSMVWYIETVDSGGLVGRYTSLAVDADDHPHISYYDASNTDLKYAYLDASGWNKSGFYDSGSSGTHSSLALDSRGYPHISYYRGSSTDLRYLYQDSTGWHFDTIHSASSDLGRYSSLALDPFTEWPKVSYAWNIEVAPGTWLPHYMVREWTPSGWTPMLEASTGGEYSSLAIDQWGGTHVSYYVGDETKLNYLYIDSSGGVYEEPVDNSADVGLYTSIDADVNGYPHISYYDATNDHLKYAYKDAGGWHIFSLTSSDDIGRYSSLELDASGYPHISYYNATQSSLMYSYQDASAWHHYSVDSAGNVGLYTSLALDSSGNPHISYYDADQGNLKYAVVVEPVTALLGDTSCIWGSDTCNPCVQPGVVNAFESLRQQGDVMGFYLGDHPPPRWDPPLTIHGHWQGVQRVAAGDGRYLVVTRDEIWDGETYDRSGFAMGKLYTRNTLGERYRSNRLWPRRDADETDPAWPEDVIAHTEYMPTAHSHPGSIQVLGDLMAVGTDREVHLYDLGEPESPQYLGQVLDRPGKTSSSTALAQLQDGRTLLMVADGDANPLDFYVSHLPHSHAAFSHLDEWDKDVNGDLTCDEGQFEYCWNSFQNLNLVTDCESGLLYLIGTGNLGDLGLWFPDPYGEDWASVYRVDLVGGEVKLTKVSERHFYCTHRGDEQCNFDAAAGVYVDPDGRLFLYSTVHGLNESITGWGVEFMEFRPQPHGTCHTIEDAWVEVFQDDDYGGRSLMIDYVDTADYAGHDPERYEVYGDYAKMEDFNDRTSSVRWCLPPGWAYRLYQDRVPYYPEVGGCQGEHLTLYGAGRVLEIADLDDWDFDGSPATSCSCYSPDPPVFAGIDPLTKNRLIYIAKLYADDGTSTCAMPVSVSAARAGDDGDFPTIVDVPAGAVDQTATLTYTPNLPSNPPPASLSVAGRAFTLTVTTGGAPDADYAFLKPVTVTIQYHPHEIAGVDESTLALYRWDAGGGQWVDGATTCDPASGYVRTPEDDTLSVSICRSGEYALMGSRALAAVLFDEAHDEEKTLDWDRALELSQALPWHPDPRWLYFGELEGRLSDEFSLERNVSTPLSEELLENYQALIVAVNREALSTDEIIAVRRYVAGGGGLILLGECDYVDPSTDLASTYGIGFEAPCLFGPKPDLEGTIIITNVVDHAAIGDALDYAHNWGQSLSISGSAVPLADTTGVDTWADVNGNDQYDAGEEGVFDIGAAYDIGCGRVVALADGTFADADLDWADNDVLMRALLRWVADAPPCEPPIVYLPLIVRDAP